MSLPRYEPTKQVIGESLFETIRKSKILVVGAGGIGCELLKNLVLSGFEDIEIIDLDTIDVSNLNRQFLFRQAHVGKPKSLVAKESALKFNPHCKIVAHHGNIKALEFGPTFFKKFALVMNALDNVDARKHVNRMCLASNIVLIDGGTAGYLGQVNTIKKGETECYECTPKQTQKSYAVCTIRSNPSTPIHCVVWAKLLFERLFGKADDANAVADFETIMQSNENVEEKVFDLVFNQQISKDVEMKSATVWATGAPPEGIQVHKILSSAEIEEATKVHTDAFMLKDQMVWSLKQNLQMFLESFKELRLKKEKEDRDLLFDKDDELALNFVTAATNLRAKNFHIENKSKFDVKSMAGNIVPAIATTNAIIAGMMVMEAMKVLNNKLQDCRMLHCVRNPSVLRKKQVLLYPVTLSKPNPSCYICSSNFVSMTLNCSKTTLDYFVNEVLKKKLALVHPTVTVGENIIYESGEDLDEEELEDMQAQLRKTLDQVNIVHNTVITVTDHQTDIEWKLTVVHDEKKEVEDFEIHGKSSQPVVSKATMEPAPAPAPSEPVPAAKPSNAAQATPAVQSADEDDEIMIVEDESELNKLKSSSVGEKRKREDSDRPNKRQRTSASSSKQSKQPAKETNAEGDEVLIIE